MNKKLAVFVLFFVLLFGALGGAGNGWAQPASPPSSAAQPLTLFVKSAEIKCEFISGAETCATTPGSNPTPVIVHYRRHDQAFDRLQAQNQALR